MSKLVIGDMLEIHRVQIRLIRLGTKDIVTAFAFSSFWAI